MVRLWQIFHTMKFMPTQSHGPASVTRSIHRAIALLRLLSTRTRPGWRLSDLAQHAGLDPATVHRLLASLCDEGLATRVPGSLRYSVGQMAYELGLAARPYFDLDHLAGHRLAALATELGGTLFLKMRSGVDSVCIARHDGGAPVQSLLLEVGGRRPLCLTAGGVAIYLHLPGIDQQAVEHDNLARIERDFADRRSGVLRMLKRSRRLGFGLNLGDTVPGIAAVSVAVLAPGGTAVAALSLARAVPSLPQADASRLATQLRLHAAALEPLLAGLRL